MSDALLLPLFAVVCFFLLVHAYTPQNLFCEGCEKRNEKQKIQTQHTHRCLVSIMPAPKTAHTKSLNLPVEVLYKDHIDDGTNKHNIALRPIEELTKKEREIRAKLEKGMDISYPFMSHCILAQGSNLTLVLGTRIPMLILNMLTNCWTLKVRTRTKSHTLNARITTHLLS